MKLSHASTLAFLILAPNAVAHDDETPLRGMQIITDGENCGPMSPPPTDEVRCARALFPPDNSYRYLPDVTYTFWKCGLGSKDGCTCGITRVVTAGPSEAVTMLDGEHLSEKGCNAQCKRSNNDKCWVCLTSTSENGWTHHFCKHKGDIAPFMLGTPGKKIRW
eukprot:CAMPEP_0183709644 /NCGR_PEP_ID=MMETSP0737-20130205/5653_1 /TAXON_ID=385413 /ORGANISM="Thalassiosira miniscula, Strain CCMP1093" /LENGTH=162 /DNA_ID=CAMNT_0025937801 /DNA_START=1 /DNA_END=486 /DNA_ORIENTATION=-